MQSADRHCLQSVHSVTRAAIGAMEQSLHCTGISLLPRRKAFLQSLAAALFNLHSHVQSKTFQLITASLYQLNPRYK